MRAIQVWLVLLWVCGCGCAPQKSLARRLKDADRVVVTGHSGTNSISLTGAEVGRIVRAIAVAKRTSPSIKSSYGFQLEFFRGTEHLGTVRTSYLVFWIERNPHLDTTETLKTLYERIREPNHPTLPR